MPAPISFINTTDNYPGNNAPGAPILGPIDQVVSITFQVSGANALYQLAKMNKDGSVNWDEIDLPAQPGSGGFSGRCYGIKFKSAVSGTPAIISAIAFFPDDAIPFQQIQAGSGGGGGAGTISDITSADGSIRIANPTGPTTDLGAVGEIESTDGSVAITNPVGPIVNLSVSPAPVTPGLIFEQTLLVDSPSVTIASIPQFGKDLQLVAYARTSDLGAVDAILCQLNGDTGAHYDWLQFAYGSTGGLFTANSFSTTSLWLGECADDGGPTFQFSALNCTFPGYSTAIAYKQFVSIFSYSKYPFDQMVAGLNGGTWHSATAITSMKLFPATGPNFKAGTTFTLYSI